MMVRLLAASVAPSLLTLASSARSLSHSLSHRLSLSFPLSLFLSILLALTLSYRGCFSNSGLNAINNSNCYVHYIMELNAQYRRSADFLYPITEIIT